MVDHHGLLARQGARCEAHQIILSQEDGRRACQSWDKGVSLKRM